MKILKKIAFLLVFVMLISSCGSSKSEYNKNDTMETEFVSEKMEAKEQSFDTSDEAKLETRGFGDYLETRKIIRRFNYYIETLEFEKSLENVYSLVNKNRGYIEYENSEGSGINNSSNRSSYFIIRIPRINTEGFRNEIKAIGTIVSNDMSSDDVTAQYQDIEVRIKTLKVQEERLLEILKEADELEYIIKLEQELSQVRYNIESYEANKRGLDNKIDFSTYEIRLSEVKEYTPSKPITFGQKLIKAFQDGFETAGEVVLGLVLIIVGGLPLIILLFVIVFVVLHIVKKRKKITVKKQEPKQKDSK